MVKDVVVIDGDVSLVKVLNGDSGNVSLVNMLDGDPRVHILETQNYNKLSNKPSINGVELIGNKDSSDLGVLSYSHATTAEWNARPNYVPRNNEVCIYDDYRIITDIDGNQDLVKGVKIGDGNAYLIDLPFITDGIDNSLSDHINNTSVHTNSMEKTVWNSKLNCDGVIDETLIFS